jgi:hypothetical protein
MAIFGNGNYTYKAIDKTIALPMVFLKKVSNFQFKKFRFIDFAAYRTGN